MADLHALFGPIDIYLFDQLLRGRITPGMQILDAGCGSGRNLHYLLQSGFDVYGADADARSIAAVRALAAQLAPQLSSHNFRREPVEAMTFAPAFVDVVVCSAVLHFARDESHFTAMLNGCWRALKPGGMFFARLASSMGMESRVQRISGRRFRLPDGSDRFLVDEALLEQHRATLNAELLDPIKTTIVQDQRCMTTWVLRKHAGDR